MCSSRGYDKSDRKCSAVGSRCNFCNGMNHLSKVCRKKSRTNIIQEDSSSDEDFTHVINIVSDSVTTDWTEEIHVGSQTLTVHIDTGAAQSLIPYGMFQSYTRHPIKVEGRVTLPTRYKDKCVDVQYYIVHVNQQPLLSGQASSDLGLIERVHNVKDEIDIYPELKLTTTILPGTYSLKINPAVPPVVYDPRRQPKVLTGKTIEKLKEVESSGHITEVVEPTDWVSSMVAVVKKLQSPDLYGRPN